MPTIRKGQMNLTNEEYEKLLLGAILIDNHIIEEYPIDAALFDTVKAGEIFRIVLLVIASGAQANIIEVSMRLPADRAYIASLTDNPSAANVGYYIEQLRELSRRRAIVKMARDAMDMVRDYENSSGDIIQECDKMLLDISMDRKAGYKHVSECLGPALDNILEAFNRKGAIGGIDTGFPELNEKTNGWQPQTLDVIGARPGSGKTSIALNMTAAAIRAGHAVGFFSAEMSAPAIIKRMLSDWGNVEYARLNSGLVSNTDLQRVEEAIAKIAKEKLFINDRANISLGEVVSESRRMRSKESVEIIFIDYLSLIANVKGNIPRHEQVAEISRTLKGLARELNIPIVVLSQLTREAQGERPKLSQLRDSGAVEQDADIVALLWNKGYTDDTKQLLNVIFIVEKNRNGSTGDIPMVFRPSRMHFREEGGQGV